MSENECSTSEDRTNLNLPPPPEEPQPSDCCGSGCSPCVFDIYDQEVVKWKTECSLLESGLGNQPCDPDEHAGTAVLNSSDYREFELESVGRLTRDTCLYRFSIPGNKKLGLLVGQHLLLRWVEQCLGKVGW